MPAVAPAIVHTNCVDVADVTVQLPDVPMITVFELGVVLNPVPVMVNVVPDCVIDDTVGVWADNHWKSHVFVPEHWEG